MSDKAPGGNISSALRGAVEDVAVGDTLPSEDVVPNGPASRPSAERPSSDPEELVGTILGGKYELQSLLGEGGMGAVYEGHHELIGSKVAVKVLHPEIAAQANTVTGCEASSHERARGRRSTRIRGCSSVLLALA
jgi:serine/threonine protein kinase